MRLTPLLLLIRAPWTGPYMTNALGWFFFEHPSTTKAEAGFLLVYAQTQKFDPILYNDFYDLGRTLSWS